MAHRHNLSKNLPSLVKGTVTVAVLAHQRESGRAFHDEDDAAGGGAGGSTATTTVLSGSRDENVVGSGMISTSGVAKGPFSSSSSSLSPERLISAKEVEEASRILFAPESDVQQHHHHRHQPPASSKAIGNTAAASTLPAVAAAAAAGGGGGALKMDHSEPETEEGSLSPLPPPMFRARRAATSAAAGAAGGGGGGGDGGAFSSFSAASSASSLTRLHPKPEVHAEILRFGMALASNPKIQTAIREELELHHTCPASLEEGDGSGIDGEVGVQQEATVADIESTVRRLLGRNVGLEDDEESSMGSLTGSVASNASTANGGFLAGSFEMLGMLMEGDEEEQEGEDVAENLPSNSFYSLGRNMRRKDSLAGDVSEEVLDELLRSDDDDDVITQKLFAQTPDEQVRRYLRNLDLECVICHEYMVEAAAVDCGEGHTFCGECIERWLDSEQEGKSRCPTCQKPVQSCIPMRQYDAIIEKYVRASNLWDEQCSFYRRKTLARMRRELERHEREEEEQDAAAREAAAAGPFAGLSSLFGLGGGGGGDATRRRRRARTCYATGRNGDVRSSSSSSASETSHQHRGEGSAGDAAEPWWKSEVLHKALSVATMLVLLVLFRRGVKVR